jgi:uncharacterized protein YaaN involved in tellurite resistance
MSENEARGRADTAEGLLTDDTGAGLRSYAEVDPRTRSAIEKLMAEVDLRDSSSLLFFGAKAQQQLTEVSDRMLEGVRNKDTGPAGSALSEMVSALRGFDSEELDPGRKRRVLDRLLGRAKPVARFLQQYEEVRKQIDGISDQLERHKTQLLTDVTSLDRLYAATLDYFRELELYIGAGTERLRRLDEEEIPALVARAGSSEEVLDAQALRDLRAARDELERRVHDLRLTRQVTMQALPSIRLVQENDKGLINKIGSTLVNTVPLWRQQLAQAVTIFRSGEAAGTLKSASDLTNELLEANARNLKQANAQVREQMERGIFDIESVKRANRTLIETIEESLRIADEGKQKRAVATQELEACERELRQTLAAASARAGARTAASRP